MPNLCRNVIAARGKPAQADAAYARAVKPAPSLPQPYQHWGEALVKRGDHTRAEAMFRKANALGPRWADPLKSLGDLAALRGEWRAALGLYKEAMPLAPKWRQLAVAKERAEAAIRQIPWWRRWLAS